MGQIAVFVWIHQHWAELIAVGWALEKLLELVSTMTPWQGDDNLGVILGKLLNRLGKKPSV